MHSRPACTPTQIYATVFCLNSETAGVLSLSMSYGGEWANHTGAFQSNQSRSEGTPVLVATYESVRGFDKLRSDVPYIAPSVNVNASSLRYTFVLYESCCTLQATSS